MLRRISVLLVMSVVAVGVLASPAAAKFPPFSVRVSPTDAVIGEPVSVIVEFRELDRFGGMLDDRVVLDVNLLQVREVLANGVVSRSEGIALTPRRDTASEWRATFTPTHTGRFAVVAFGNVDPQPPDSWLPGPTRFQVHAAAPVTIAERPAAVVQRTSTSPTDDRTGLLLACVALVAAAFAGGAVVATRRRRARTA
jgi:hypothetical protein